MATKVGLYTAVKEATNNLIFNKDTKVQPSILAECWLLHFSNGLVRSTGPGHHGVDIDRFFGVILTYSLIPAIVSDTENARILACVCMVRVLASDATPHPAIHHVGHVMQAWFGHAIDYQSTLSLPPFIDSLYGPGVWELYGLDAPNIKQVPGHLYQVNLPFKGPLAHDPVSRTGSSVDLPCDM